VGVCVHDSDVFRSNAPAQLSRSIKLSEFGQSRMKHVTASIVLKVLECDHSNPSEAKLPTGFE
jgi:hypothetical protein